MNIRRKIFLNQAFQFKGQSKQKNVSTIQIAKTEERTLALLIEEPVVEASVVVNSEVPLHPALNWYAVICQPGFVGVEY